MSDSVFYINLTVPNGFYKTTTTTQSPNIFYINLFIEPDVPDVPDEPDIPDEPEEIIGYLLLEEQGYLLQDLDEYSRFIIEQYYN